MLTYSYQTELNTETERREAWTNYNFIHIYVTKL